MTRSTNGATRHFTRLCLWLIALIGVIVPRRLRADWRQEWEAELQYRETLLAEWDRLDRRAKLDLLWHSAGAFMDALWLQPRRWEDEMIQDLRFGFRMLLKHKALTVVAVLSLALGIGANTAIFSVIDALMLKRLPVRQPEQLVTFAVNYPGEGGFRSKFVYPTFKQFQERLEVFSGLSAVYLLNRSNITLNAPGGAVGVGQARVGLVSGSYFSTLGVGAVKGRTFTADDDRAPGGHPVAVISHNFWKSQLALAPDVAGRGLTLDGVTYTILGVTPAGFSGEWVGQPTDLWIPIAMQSQVMPEEPGLLTNPISSTWVRIIARVKPDVKVNQAQASAQTVFTEWLEGTFSPRALRQMGQAQIVLEPGARGFSPEREFFARPLVMALILVGLALLIACANVASLLLARAAARRKEMAVRSALGARRARIVRQMMTESSLLATLGGALGLLLARWGTDAFAKLIASGNQPISLDLQLDTRMLAFTSSLCLLTSLLFGLAPAMRAAKVSLIPALKDGGMDAVGSTRRFLLGKALVITQVALSFVLLVGAGLFVRTLRNLKTQDFGFERERVLLVRASLNQPGRQGPELANLYQTVQERISSLPGVLVASPSHGGIKPTGFMNGVFFDSAIRLVGNQTIEPGAEQRALWYVVAPGFFKAMGMRLLTGRDVSAHDTETTPRVAIINETMARRYFGSENPIGKRFGFKPDLTSEIVGVVRAEKYNSPRDENRMLIFLPYRQDPNARGARDEMLLAVRTSGAPAELAGLIRQALREVDSNLPVVSIRTMEEELDRALVQERLIAALAGFFGLFAVLLACIGLYGTMSYAVVRRTKEIGMRFALGASRANVLVMILRDGLLSAGVGITIGLAAALASTRLVSSLLFGVSAVDPLTVAGAASMMIVVTAFAGILPALRASSVDPLVALRDE